MNHKDAVKIFTHMDLCDKASNKYPIFYGEWDVDPGSFRDCMHMAGEIVTTPFPAFNLRATNQDWCVRLHLNTPTVCCSFGWLDKKNELYIYFVELNLSTQQAGIHRNVYIYKNGKHYNGQSFEGDTVEDKNLHYISRCAVHSALKMLMNMDNPEMVIVDHDSRGGVCRENINKSRGAYYDTRTVISRKKYIHLSRNHSVSKKEDRDRETHFRRSHYRILRSPRYGKNVGKMIKVKASWINSDSYLKTYEVK